MKFGVFDQSEQPGGLALGELLESRLTLAERAEQAGFWGYHKSEHHLTPLDHAPSIAMFLSALAQRTSRMRLCSLVHMLPFYHPLRLYEEVCMLDHMSGGRFELGFGKGISGPEHTLWGLDPDEAVPRTAEVLDVLRTAFDSQDHLSYSGEFYNYDSVPLELKPLQQPHPPLWRPGTLETAAKMGVNAVTAGPTEMVHSALERYQSLLTATPINESPMAGVIRKFIVAPTDAEADELGRAAWKRYTHNLGLLFRLFDAPIPNDPTVGGDYDLAKEFNVVVAGSPERVRAHYDELVSSPLVTYVIGSFAFGNLSHEHALRSLDLFSEHVVADQL